MNIAVCDDDKVHIELLKRYLHAAKYLCPKMQVAVFFSGEELLKATLHKKFDIIFLDIKMKKLSGMDTAIEIRKVDCDVIIIFITGLMNYVFYGYKVKAFRYLMKPISEKHFLEAFAEAKKEYHAFKQDLFYFDHKGETIKLNIRDIVYFESQKRVIFIHTKTKTFEFYAKLNDIEGQFKKSSFIRPHQSFLINVEHIDVLSGVNFVMQTGALIPISEKKKKEALDIFTCHLTRYAK